MKPDILQSFKIPFAARYVYLEYSKRQQTSLVSRPLSYVIKYIIRYFLNVWLRIWHCVSFARPCKLIYLKEKQTKTSLRLLFFYLYFFIVWLPHWILDLSLNAQPGVNIFFLLFIYILHFMMKLCRIIVCVVFYLFSWHYTVNQFGFVMLFYNTSFVS